MTRRWNVPAVDRAVVLGWAVAACGGLVWWAAGGPLPWLLGPMVAFGIARGVGAPVAEWGWGRALGQCLIGVGLGLRFTPEVVGGLVARWPVLLTLAVLALTPAFVGVWAYRRWAGLDRAGAWLCALPGGASEMAVLAERHGVSAATVALTQGLRVALVVSLVPWSAVRVEGGLHGPAEAASSAAGASAFVVACTLGWALLLAAPTAWLHRRHWPNVWMMLPLLATAILTAWLGQGADGRSPMALPVGLMDTAQLLLGITLGSKLDAPAWRRAPRLSLVAAGVVLVSMAVCAVLAWLLALGVNGVPAPWLTHYLALAPGGMAEMALMARQSGAFLPEVIATHVLRLMLVLAVAPTLMRRLAVPVPRAVAGRAPPSDGGNG